MPQNGPEMESARRMAGNYERYFVPAIGVPVARDLLTAADLRPGERVLDAACGTGVVARLAAERVAPGGSVAGLDPNPGMIAVARDSSPAGSSIDWYEAPGEKIPLPDASFDVVLCSMGLQFFADREAGLKEFLRVLVPGGRLVAGLPGPTPPPLEIMADALAKHIGPECASFVQAVFALHDPDELRELARRAGFHDIQTRSSVVPLRLPPPGEFLRQYLSSTPLGAAVAQADDEIRAALETDFAERCRRLAPKGAPAGGVRLTTLIAM